MTAAEATERASQNPEKNYDDEACFLANFFSFFLKLSSNTLLTLMCTGTQFESK